MTDEVMEPLTGMEFDKKRSKKPNDFVDNSNPVAAPKTPDKKKKKFFFPKSKAKQDKQDKKRTMKSELITNSIQNPSNHPIPEETPGQHLGVLHTNHLSHSPDLGEETNDSRSLLKNPQPVFLSKQIPVSTQPSLPLSNPKKSYAETQDGTTHDVPLLSPSSQDLPPEHVLSESSVESNPVLTGKPSPWEPNPSPECQIEPNLGLSQSWEKCRDPPEQPPFSATTSNSYDSHLNKPAVPPTGSDEFPPVAGLPLKSSSHDSIPHSPQDDSQITYFPSTGTNSQSLFSKSLSSHSLSSTLPSSNSPYLITTSEFQSFSSFFSALNPQDGLLYGEQARAYFLRSGLPNEELSRIWKLSDLDNDKKLTFSEFCIAMKLVRNRKKDVPLPNTLPPSILESLKTLANSVEFPRTLQTDSLPDSDSPADLSDDIPLLDLGTAEKSPLLSTDQTEEPNSQPAPNVNMTEGTHRETESPISDAPSDQLEETDLLSSELSQPESLEGKEQGGLDDTVTAESLQSELAGEIEDPIPKLSNSSNTTDYKDQIKSIFTPIPNPIPPPPSKTEIRKRSLHPAQDPVVPSPRIDVTPVQMRAHTVSNTKTNPPGHLDLGDNESPMILSLTPRGNTDPKDMARSKYNRMQKRNDRISAVVLLDREESQVSLINRGEVQTFELSPRGDDISECVEERFFNELNALGKPAAETMKFRERSPNFSSPNKVEPISNKPKKFKFFGRNKKSDSTASIEKVVNGDSLLRKKKVKKLSKKESKQNSKHKRASSYDMDSSGKPRLYSSQNDLTSPNKCDHRKIVMAMTSDQLSARFSPQRSSSTQSLSPSHKARCEIQTQRDNDSFDSGGSSEEVPSDGEPIVRMRTHTTGSIEYRNNRSVSSPECIMSTTPVPEPDSDYRYTTASEVDEKTPIHQPEVLSNSQERDLLRQRIVTMASRCESLRGVNTDLRDELNQIRLQKNELKMQLRFRTRNYL